MLACGGYETGWPLDDYARQGWEDHNSGLMSCGTMVRGDHVYQYGRTVTTGSPNGLRRMCFRTPVSGWPARTTRSWQVVSEDVTPRSVLDDDAVYGTWIADTVAAWIAEDPTGRAAYEFYFWRSLRATPFETSDGLKFAATMDILVADPADIDGTKTNIQYTSWVFDLADDMITLTRPRVLIDVDGATLGNTLGTYFEAEGQPLMVVAQVRDVSAAASPTGYTRQYSRIGVQPVEIDTVTDAVQGAALPGAPGAGFRVARIDPDDFSEIHDCLSGGSGDAVELQWGRSPIEDGYVYTFAPANMTEIIQSKKYDAATMTDPTVNYRETEGVPYHDYPDFVLGWRCPIESAADGAAWERAPSPVAVQAGRMRAMWSPNAIRIRDRWWMTHEANLINADRVYQPYASFRHVMYRFWSADGIGAHPGLTLQELDGPLAGLFEDPIPDNAVIRLRAFDGAYLQGSGALAGTPYSFVVRKRHGFWRLEDESGTFLEGANAPLNLSVYVGCDVVAGAKRFDFGAADDPGWPGPYDPVTDDPAYCGPGVPAATGADGYPPGARPQQWWPVEMDGLLYLQNRWSSLYLTSDGTDVYLDRWWRSGKQAWHVELVA